MLAKLKEQGEFVKSASSTVEAPVARRLREDRAVHRRDAGRAARRRQRHLRRLPRAVPAGRPADRRRRGSAAP
ncbi:hypothetical protein NH342_22625, partial [Klenkia sp. PcliD-1-E]|nr:hypothetical protein [Klenkia sp. PcliD-1-E]